MNGNEGDLSSPIIGLSTCCDLCALMIGLGNNTHSFVVALKLSEC